MSIIDSIDVFFDRLKDIRSATQLMVGTLPDLQRWTTGTSLRDLLTTYQHANARHLPEVLAIFDEYSKEPGEDDCKAGLIEGGNGHIEIAGYSVRNLLLVARSLRIGYYLGAAVEVALGVATRSGLAVERTRWTRS
ncbi:DUF892 family protein [Luteolibacter sp. GHJ8]|uniref:DUF892 family protein n=1 Tax=Luteolibacter rhizosphaerae TaxID=2989719 RepID=A0ABT3G0A6_9BACT|nr:DUF892 family protein [Luteolibacter rhizosphaerae]MCW1912946.1 DUF892 family protein [Luteolibacter rhizosphaerae]